MVREMTKKELAGVGKVGWQPLGWWMLHGDLRVVDADDVEMSYPCRQCGRRCRVVVAQSTIDDAHETGDVSVFRRDGGFLGLCLLCGLCPEAVLCCLQEKNKGG